MFENKLVDLLLKLVPQSKWNLLSNLFSRMSIPTIGSPISFKYGNFTIKEFNLLKMDKLQKEKFLEFCYPLDMADRKKEIKIDRQYWRTAATFIVFDANDSIIGCAQYISKIYGSRLPVEFAHVIEKSETSNCDIGIFFKSILPHGSCAEIYRCRRSFGINRHDSFLVVHMLFKALWAKIIQESAQYIYITFNPIAHELYNLYIRKLCFQNPGILVRFGNNPQNWELLIKDCLYQENELAALSPSHFIMQTWFRKNLRKKNLRIRPHGPVTARLISPKKTVLRTHVVLPCQSQTSARRHLLRQVKKRKLTSLEKKSSAPTNSRPS